MGAVNISYGDPETIDAGVVVGHEFNDKVNSIYNVAASREPEDEKIYDL